MSRINRGGLTNPANRFFEWAAQDGKLTYYNKDTKERVTVKLPFQFIVLDEVSQIGGGTKRAGKYEGYFSNAVKNLNTQKFTVKSKQGIEAEGYYADLKARKGFHYVKGLYIAYKNGSSDLQIGYLKIKGSALGAWFEFAGSKNLYDGVFSIKSRSDVINGDQGDYYTPVFSHTSQITDETEDQAGELQAEVIKYLEAYFAQGAEQSSAGYSGPIAITGNNEPPDYPAREPEEVPEDYPEDSSEIPF